MFAQTTQEERDESEVYEDVESLIVPGFLAHAVSVGDISLSLRSLTAHDYFLLRHRLPPHAPARDWKSWTISQAVWMLDGHLVMNDPNGARFVWETFRYLPESVLSMLFSIVKSLLNRSHEAVARVEAYCYENQSRYLWRRIGHHLSHVASGVESLGVSTVQQIWIAYNESEDQRESDRGRWEESKFIAASAAGSGKGLKKLSASEKRSDEAEARRRQEVMDRAYYRTKGVKVDAKTAKEIARKKRRYWAPESVEELEDEYQKWLSGELDSHDRAVQHHKEQIRGHMRKRAEDARIAREESMRIRDTQPLPSELASQPVAYTKDQLAALMHERGPQRPGTTKIVYEPRAQKVYDTWIDKDVVLPEHLAAEGKRVRLTDGDRFVVEEDTSQPQTLQEKIAARRPTLGDIPRKGDS